VSNFTLNYRNTGFYLLRQDTIVEKVTQRCLAPLGYFLVSILAIINRYHKNYFALVINLIEKPVATYSITPGIRIIV